MCDNCVALRTRVEQLEGAIRAEIEWLRPMVSTAPDSLSRRYDALRAALTASPSPLGDVVRAAVALDDVHDMSRTAELARLSIAVAALLDVQPEWGA